MEIGSSVCKLKIRCYDIVILVIIFVMLFEPARSWDNEDLELFDLVEEMSTLNKTFYEVLGLTQVFL